MMLNKDFFAVSCSRTVYSLIVGSLLVLNSSVHSQESLIASDWQGVIVTTENVHHEVAYKAEYLKNDDGFYRLKLILRYVNETPVSNYTYELKNVSVNEEALTFAIEKENELIKCELNYDNGGYSGKCLSSISAQGKKSSITMKPLQAASIDSEA